MRVVRKVLHAAAVLAGFVSFFLIIGTAGAIDQDCIDTDTGFKEMFIFLAIFALCVLIGNLCKGEEYENEDMYIRR